MFVRAEIETWPISLPGHLHWFQSPTGPEPNVPHFYFYFFISISLLFYIFFLKMCLFDFFKWILLTTTASVNLLYLVEKCPDFPSSSLHDAGVEHVSRIRTSHHPNHFGSKLLLITPAISTPANGNNSSAVSTEATPTDRVSVGSLRHRHRARQQ